MTQSEEVRDVRTLVLRYGWNATAYQLVNPGIQHWFAAGQDGVVGYVVRSGRRVVAGAPVCAEDRLASLIDEWQAAGPEPACYFGAAGRIQNLLEVRSGYRTVVMGAQPVWNPQHWNPERFASLRQQFSRARHKGVRIEEWPPETAEGHPELWRVLREWLASRGLPPLHFLVEPETLAHLEGRRIFVARRKEEVVAFLVLSPIPVRNGWLTEQFPRTRESPNGTMELLVDTAVRAVALDGATYLTMGLVPLSRLGQPPQLKNPWWLRGLAGWVRAHGRRFYNFEGLEAFKAKFRPEGWEPIYVVSNERRFSFRTLYAIASAFTRTSPWLALARGFGRAIGQEWRWLWNRRR